jgi:hypothetical protein
MFRALALALFAAFGFGLAAPAPAQTAVSQYPFCIQGEDNLGWSGCSFDTLEACQAAASGTFAECLSNPWYRASGNASLNTDGNQIGANAPIPVGPPPN